MKLISKSQVLMIHGELIGQTGGMDGVRDEGLLESALVSPFQTFDGTDVYPSLQAKAAQLGFGIIKNHPFLDGNKRTGAHIMILLLALNGVTLSYTQKELYTVILSVADGSADSKALTQWILLHQN